MSASTPQDLILGIPPNCSMPCVRTLLAVVSLLTLGSSQLTFAQEVSATLGVTRTIKSTILGEDRKVFVRLPTGYDTSGNAYPVLYLLDGTPAFLLEMTAITTRLRNDRKAPEMIIVAIENTNRNRDMMPVVAKGYPGPPRAEAFLGFLEKELIPDIEKTYRTSQPRILLGKSLSGLFAVYSLLARPTAFDAYVGCSAGWFAENNEYFLELSTRAFRTVESFANRRVFMANSLKDQYDPDQAIHRQMMGLSELIERNVGETLSYRYETYENYPHVPFPCLYDGLRFVTMAQPKK
jgi:predicted alpha/beta superfamily hydrolase